MREYESVFVLNPSTEDAQVDAEIQKVRDFLETKECEITEVQKWGRRKLAYEINKNREGIYTLVRFNSEGDVPVELDRRYRLNENMMRYLTVVYEHAPAGEGLAEGEAGEGAEGTPAAAPAATPAAVPAAEATPVATTEAVATAPAATTPAAGPTDESAADSQSETPEAESDSPAKE